MNLNINALFQPLEGADCADLNILIVGGAIRDSLLGLTPKDIDFVAVGIKPETLLSRGFLQIGRDFPVFLHPISHVEVALARTERKIAEGHTGFTVHADPSVSLEDDLRRRDFTINAIALARDGTLTDPYGGQNDLNARRLQHVSDAFSEDPLRVFRGIRFLAQLASFDFEPAPETAELMRKMVPTFRELSVERIVSEIDQTLKTEKPEVGLKWIPRLGITQSLAPELNCLPHRFLTNFPETRLAEWAFKNRPSLGCIQVYCSKFRLSLSKQRLLRAILTLRKVEVIDASNILSTMNQLGWLRGNAPDPTIDRLLVEADKAALTSIPVSTWLKLRSIVRQVTAETVEGEISGRSLGEAIYAQRLRVLSTEISAPGTAPGL